MKTPALKGMYQRGEIWWLAFPMKNGHRHKPVSLQTTDLTEAISRADEIRANPIVAPADTLTAEMEAHISYMVGRKKYSASSVKPKRYNLQSFISSLPRGTAFGAVSTAQVQSFYDASLKSRSLATAHKRLMDIRAWFGWALTLKKVRRNPVIDVKHEPAGGNARVRFCTVEQRDKLINECPREDLKFVLVMGFHCGLRKQEIIEAVAKWYNMKERFIDMHPTPTMPFNRHKKPRPVPMRQVVIDFLGEYGLPEPFMLRPDVKAGKDIYRYDFDLPLQKYVKTQGMEWVTAHVMRHTFASLLVIEGKSIYKVAKWIGDTVATTEKHYAHLAPKDDDIEEHPVKKTKVKAKGIRRR